MKYKNKIILITGANGQDGIILSQIFLKKKFKVFGVVKKIPKKKIPGVKYYISNLKNYSSVKLILQKVKPDIIYHFASENPSFKDKKIGFFKNNMKISKNLAKYILKENLNIKFIFPGSSKIYGKQRGKISEKNKFKPEDSYSNFRVKFHEYMIKNKKKYNLNYTMAILFNHDSKYRNKKFMTSRLVNSFKLRKFNLINELIQSNTSADFSHADDICNGMYKLGISNYNFNHIIFSSNKATSIINIINYLFMIFKFKKKFKVSKSKKCITGDNSLAKKTLKWRPKKSIFDAVKELYLNEE